MAYSQKERKTLIPYFSRQEILNKLSDNLARRAQEIPAPWLEKVLGNSIHFRHEGKDFSFSSSLVIDMIRTVNPRVLSAFIKPLILSSRIFPEYQPMGRKVREKRALELKINELPVVLIAEVTSSCNITPPCKDCFTTPQREAYSDEPSLAELKSLVHQAADLGIDTVVFSGGEPLLRETDLTEVMKSFPQLFFVIFTNGTLIGERTAERFLDTGTLSAFFLSLEGFEQTTDRRRGKGTFKKVIGGMNNLKKERFPFGFSITVTGENVDEVTSDKFIEFLKSQGCGFGIYLAFKPTERENKASVLSLEQKGALMKSTQRLRESEKMLVFTSEEFLSQESCPAGRQYWTISPQGELRPCVFMSRSDPNIKLYGEGAMTLITAIQTLYAPLLHLRESLPNSKEICLVEEGLSLKT